MPVESTTITETITQIQSSGCISHCQGMSQVQQASQTSVTIQTIGTAAEQPTELAGQSPSPQITSTITQIQIGCVSQCFGVTATGTATGALAEQLLTELGSLTAPDGSSSPEPVPGVAQTVVDETSCQLQSGQASTGTQLQTASQSSVTVQLSDVTASLPTYFSSPSGGSQAPVDQTQQQIWQLQIGCLFYCVETQQVQQAQQTITTIQVLAEQPGPAGAGPPAPSTMGTVTVAQQVIWQVQIGCLAWCYDATSFQSASSQTTVAVITPSPPPSTTPPPAAPPPSGTMSNSPQTPATGQAGSAPAVASAPPATPGAPTKPPSAPPITAGPSPTEPVSRSLGETGSVIVDRRLSSTADVTPAPAAVVSAAWHPVPGTVSQSIADAYVSIAAAPSSPQSHRPRRLAPRPIRALSVPLATTAVRAHPTVSLVLVALAIAAAVALLALGARDRLPARRPEA